MLNVGEIKETISELEKQKTTFDTCHKLASLYIILDHINTNKIYDEHTNKENKVIEEYSDILPSYKKYCEIKRNYQLGLLSDNQIQSSMKSVCLEIEEFILTLYSSTDTEIERSLIHDLLKSIEKKVKV